MSEPRRIDLGDGPVEIVVSGRLVVRLTSESVEVHTGGELATRLQGRMLFMHGVQPYATLSGTDGDLVLPNHHAALRGVFANGLGTTPLVKLTRSNTPVFGRFPTVLPTNEALRIGWPEGLLVVTDSTRRNAAVFVTCGQGGITLLADPSGSFSTRDGEAGKLVVCWIPSEIGYQIQNRTSSPLRVGWSAYGTL